MTSSDELLAWVNGTADGGPNGDGRYPLTDKAGAVHLVPCPLADQSSLDEASTVLTGLVAEAEAARDAALAAQAAAEEAASGGGGGGTAITRETATISSTGADVYGTVAMSKSAMLVRLETTAPCRVRLYDTAAHRDADKLRTATQEPPMGNGLQFEGLTQVGLLSFNLAPAALVFSGSEPPSTSIAYSLQPVGGVATSVTLTYLDIQ